MAKVKLSKGTTIFFFLIGAGAFLVFTAFRSGSYGSTQECLARLPESQIRSIVVSEMQAQQAAPKRIRVAQLENSDFGKIEIKINPDWYAHADNEYSASMYFVVFSEADFTFWANLGSCGHVNMAGTRNFSNEGNF